MRITAALVASILAAPHAAAETGFCDSHARITETLTTQLGETRHGVGLRDPDSAMELWQSERGSWTLVLRYANGRSCIVATGEDWQSLAALNQS